MKGKTGVDRMTQIEENDPELFDFNYEVQPIVDALLSKIIETSRMELYEEKNLQEKEKEKIEYEQRRHTRLA
jgi:radial spoke head protein 3